MYIISGADLHHLREADADLKQDAKQMATYFPLANAFDNVGQQIFTKIIDDSCSILECSAIFQLEDFAFIDCVCLVLEFSYDLSERFGEPVRFDFLAEFFLFLAEITTGTKGILGLSTVSCEVPAIYNEIELYRNFLDDFKTLDKGYPLQFLFYDLMTTNYQQFSFFNGISGVQLSPWEYNYLSVLSLDMTEMLEKYDGFEVYNTVDLGFEDYVTFIAIEDLPLPSRFFLSPVA